MMTPADLSPYEYLLEFTSTIMREKTSIILLSREGRDGHAYRRLPTRYDFMPPLSRLRHVDARRANT